MIFAYGTKKFETGEFRPLSFVTRGKRSDRRILEAISKTMRVEFEVIRSGQAALTQRIKEIDQAITRDGVDVGFYQDDGQRSWIWLTSGNSTSGVYISEYPSISDLADADYANSLKGTVEFSADYSPSALGIAGGKEKEQLLDYEEAIAFKGNGKKREVWAESDTGEPEKFTLADKTLCFAEQRGSLSSLSPNVQRNPPIWPDLLDNDSDAQSPAVATRSGSGQTEYSLSWSYSFTSGKPFVGGKPKVR